MRGAWRRRRLRESLKPSLAGMDVTTPPFVEELSSIIIPSEETVRHLWEGSSPYDQEESYAEREASSFPSEGFEGEASPLSSQARTLRTQVLLGDLPGRSPVCRMG